jgi:hypothetical protein
MKRDFKGVWIPKEIWINRDLSFMEKLFLIEIDSLDNENGCFAMNAYFSEFFIMSKSRVSQIISRLAELGLIDVTLKYAPNKKQILGRTIHVTDAFRKLKGGLDDENKPLSDVGLPSLENKSTPLVSKSTPLENCVDNNTDNNTSNNTREEEEKTALALPSNPDQSQIKNENQEPQPENKTAEQPEKETPQIAAAPLIEDVEVEDLFTEPKTDEIDPAQIIVDKIMKAPRVKKEMWYVRHGVNGDLPERAYEYATFYISKYCMEMPDDSLIPYLKNANSNALQSGFETSWLRNLKRYAPKPEEMTAEELRKKRDYDLEQYCINNGIE